MHTNRAAHYRYEPIFINYTAEEVEKTLKVRIKKEASSARQDEINLPDRKDFSQQITSTDKILDLEIYLDADQHTEFLKSFGQNQQGISNATSCYTTIFQHNLARFNYGKIGETDEEYKPDLKGDENGFDRVFFSVGEKIKTFYGMVNRFFKKILHFTQGNEAQAKTLMDTLRSCSEEFAELEALVNNPPGSDLYVAIETLQKKVNKAYQGIETKLQTYANKCKESEELIRKLKDNLRNGKELFLANLEEQKAIRYAENPLGLIFNMQNRCRGTISLGSFVAGQIISLCAAGIDEVYRIGGGRASQLLHTHSAIRCLSNTKSELDARARSLHGVGLNNTRSPYSAGMIASLQPSVLPRDHKGGWVKITDYVENGLENLDEIDKIFCFITKQPVNARTHHKYAFFLRVGQFICSVVELFIYSPIHLIFTVVSFSLGTLLQAVPFLVCAVLYTVTTVVADIIILILSLPVVRTGFGKLMQWVGLNAEAVCDQVRHKINFYWEKSKAGFERYRSVLNMQIIDQTAEAWHHQLSCVRWCRNKLKEGYQRDPESSSHQPALNKIKGHAFSFYNQLLSRFSGHRINTYLTDFITQTVYSATSIIRELGFILQPKSLAKRRAVFEERRDQTQKLMEEITEHLLTSSKTLLSKESSVSDTRTLLQSDRSPSEDYYWPLIEPQPTNSVPSILAVPEELVLSFFKGVIDPACRNNCFSSTALFMVSLLTLGALAAPVTLKMGGLRDFCIYLNKLFGQEIAAKGLPNQIVGVTLQWQALYGSYEGSKELLQGNTELIKWVLSNSEKIVMGLAGAIVTGKLLQFLPPVPTDGLSKAVECIHEAIDLTLPHTALLHFGLNYYVSFLNSFPLIMNTFSEESASVGEHGSHPFKDVEQAVFGIKFLLIVHSLVSTGGHGFHSEAELDKMKDEVVSLEAKIADKKSHEKRNLINQFLQQSSITKNIILSEERDGQSDNNSESKFSTAKIPEEKEAEAPHQKLYKAWKELREAIAVADQYSRLKALHSIVDQKGLHNDPSSGKLRAALYFDYLTEKFDQYNAALAECDYHHHDLQDDLYQQDYLHSFFNKHCYEGTTTLFRLMTLALFWPLALSYRGVKYLIACTETFYSPAVRQQIKMEMANDLAFWFQLLGLLAWIAKGTARPVGYVVRVLVGLPMIIVGSLYTGLVHGFSAINPFISKCMDSIAQFTPHRFDGISWLGPAYAATARVAGINSEDLNVNTDRLLKKLDKNNPHNIVKQPSNAVSTELSITSCSDNLIKKLTAYKQETRRRRLRPTNSARPQQVKMLSEIVHDTTLSEQQKKLRIWPIVKSLSGNSRLKQAVKDVFETSSNSPARQTYTGR